MATIRDIITRSLRIARVSPWGETPAAEDTDEALTALNAMLAGWKLASVDIEHTPLGLSDTFPLAAEFEEGTEYMLAARLSVENNQPVGFDPDDFFRRIQAAYIEIEQPTMDNSLLRTPTGRRGYWYP